jgi:RNA polymerase sigma-70 factor (ECF subfamily)
MVHGVAFAVLRDAALAQDAAQESYLRAFRHLSELNEPAAFNGWLRRIAVTVAMNLRRSLRNTLLRLDDVPEIPILDETEGEWSELQRQRLAAALLTLTPEERRICERRYYGRWTTGAPR